MYSTIACVEWADDHFDRGLSKSIHFDEENRRHVTDGQTDGRGAKLSAAPAWGGPHNKFVHQSMQIQ